MKEYHANPDQQISFPSPNPPKISVIEPFQPYFDSTTTSHDTRSWHRRFKHRQIKTMICAYLAVSMFTLDDFSSLTITI